jgi:hypothetical protein
LELLDGFVVFPKTVFCVKKIFTKIFLFFFNFVFFLIVLNCFFRTFSASGDPLGARHSAASVGLSGRHPSFRPFPLAYRPFPDEALRIFLFNWDAIFPFKLLSTIIILILFMYF